MLGAVPDLAATLTPAPVAAPSIAARLGRSSAAGNRWRRPPSTATTTWPGWTWARRHLDRLVTLEQTWPAAAAGRTLLHLDLRADSLLLTPTR